MPHQSRVVAPAQPTTQRSRQQAAPYAVRFEDGTIHAIPEGWALLPPGDAGLTRRVKAAGPAWTVKEQRGRKSFSRGVWAPAAHIATARRRLEVERADPAYQRKLDASRQRATAQQETYVVDFGAAILAYLDFAPMHADMAAQIAERVAAHATPVGSGTVARTKRIPIEERAKAAVLAWMRHQTTDYDHRVISRERGRRREVRRELSKASRRLLGCYRRGETPPADCPLLRAVTRPRLSTAVPTRAVARRPPPSSATLTAKTPEKRAASRITSPQTATKPVKKTTSVSRRSPWGPIARRPKKAGLDDAT